MRFVRSIRFKIVFFSILIEIVMLGLLITNSKRLIESHLTTQATKQLQELKENFHASLLPLLVVRDYAGLDSLLKEYTNSKKIEYVFIIKEGQIIATSNWDKSQVFPKINTTFDTNLKIYNAKVTVNSFGQNYGEVYFGIDTTFLQKAKDELVSQSFLIALSEIILSLLLLFSIGYLLTRNLLILTDAAENIANNNFDVKLDIKSNDEVGILAKTFNKMITQIKNQLSTITKQNEVQKGLIHSLDTEVHRVKAILENVGDAIHILDLEGTIFMFSDSFAHSLGYTNEEVTKLKVTDWDLVFDPKEIYGLIEHPRTFEAVHTRKDGSNFPVKIRTAGIKLDNKLYLYAASRNISERRLAEEQLRQKDILLYQQSKMASMGEMIGNIAHQWRQPLSVISTSVTGLGVKIDFGLDVEKKELLETFNRVNDTVQFLSKTIDDFQDYLKPQKQHESFNIKNVITKNLEMFGKAFENNDIEISMNCDDIFIENSQNELLQVVINILNNAKDALKEFRQEDRKIFIQLHQENQNAILSIKDNAGGIPQDVIPHIFDAYFTTKEESKGTGLGLYMSYQIITNRFKGMIEVLNEEYLYEEKRYKGANFKIIIPME